VRYPVRHLGTIEQHAGQLDSVFILAVIHAESSFRPGVVSHAGARGLMQVMPTTGEWLAAPRFMDIPDFHEDMLFDPDFNIAMGAFFLNWLYDRFGGDTTLVLAAYNAGHNRVDQWLQADDFAYDGRLKYIPFPETRNYVARVYRNRQIYEWLLRIPWMNA